MNNDWDSFPRCPECGGRHEDFNGCCSPQMRFGYISAPAPLMSEDKEVLRDNKALRKRLADARKALEEALAHDREGQSSWGPSKASSLTGLRGRRTQELWGRVWELLTLEQKD